MYMCQVRVYLPKLDLLSEKNRSWQAMFQDTLQEKEKNVII